MIGKIITAGRPGFHATLVTVEADILSGLPGLTIVGLPDHAVRESRDRIRSAMVNSGFTFPARQIVINLSPNDTPKEGGLMEAAMAAAVLVASGQLPQEPFHRTALMASLSLDGTLQPGRALAAAAVFAAGKAEVTQLLLPVSAAGEIVVPQATKVFALRSLSDLAAFAYGQIEARGGCRFTAEEEIPEITIEQIFGLQQAKRAMAIAAVGRHHMLLVGSPGTGKSLLARAYRHLLPPLNFAEAAEVTRLYSLAGLGSGELIRRRPFRSPHHSTSMAALVGGSAQARPGEISLAHRGTLFLDELPEFRNEALQSLREPLEDKRITIARARGHLTYPADFQLLAAANPCRCGNLFVDPRLCQCKPAQALTQFSKLIGPFLDRIAIELDLNNLHESTQTSQPYTTAMLQERITQARLFSLKRNNGKLNDQIEPGMLYALLEKLNPMKLFERFAGSERLTLRSWLNCLRVAFSVADFEGVDINESHIHEALAYRFLAKRIASLQHRAA